MMMRGAAKTDPILERISALLKAPNWIFLVVVLLFLPGLQVGPLDEDFGWLTWVKNRDFFRTALLNPWADRYYRPLATLIPYQLTDMLPMGLLWWRLGQILLVGCTAHRLWRLLMTVCTAPRWATILTLVWVAEFQRAYGVYYFNATDYLLLNLTLVFFLAGLLERRWASAVTWLVLGLGAKEQAVMFPLVGVLLARPLDRSAWKFFVLSFAVCGAFLFWRLDAADFLKGFSGFASRSLFGFPLDLSLQVVGKNYAFLMSETVWRGHAQDIFPSAGGATRLMGAVLLVFWAISLRRRQGAKNFAACVLSLLIFLLPMAVLGDYVKSSLVEGAIVLCVVFLQRQAGADGIFSFLSKQRFAYGAAVIFLVFVAATQSWSHMQILRARSMGYFFLIQEVSRAAENCPDGTSLTMVEFGAGWGPHRSYREHAVAWSLPRLHAGFSSQTGAGAMGAGLRLLREPGQSGMVFRVELTDPHGLCNRPSSGRGPLWKSYPFGIER